MRTLASVGIIAFGLALVALVFAGFHPALYVLIVIGVFSLLFNTGISRRRKRS